MIEGKENIFSKTETGQQSFFDWVKSFFSSSTNSVRNDIEDALDDTTGHEFCLLYTSPSPRDRTRSRMPSSA